MDKGTADCVITRGCVYTKDAFKKGAGGWSESAWKTAKRNGLTTVETAGRAYVTGDSFVDYIEGLAVKQRSSDESEDQQLDD